MTTVPTRLLPCRNVQNYGAVSPQIWPNVPDCPSRSALVRGQFCGQLFRAPRDLISTLGLRVEASVIPRLHKCTQYRLCEAARGNVSKVRTPGATKSPLPPPVPVGIVGSDFGHVSLQAVTTAHCTRAAPSHRLALLWSRAHSGTTMLVPSSSTGLWGRETDLC
jgi:hypothetical protein